MQEVVILPLPPRKLLSLPFTERVSGTQCLLPSHHRLCIASSAHWLRTPPPFCQVGWSAFSVWQGGCNDWFGWELWGGAMAPSTITFLSHGSTKSWQHRSGCQLKPPIPEPRWWIDGLLSPFFNAETSAFMYPFLIPAKTSDPWPRPVFYSLTIWVKFPPRCDTEYFQFCVTRFVARWISVSLTLHFVPVNALLEYLIVPQISVLGSKISFQTLHWLPLYVPVSIIRF